MANRLTDLVRLLEKVDGKKPNTKNDSFNWSYAIHNGDTYKRCNRNFYRQKSKFTLEDIGEMKVVYSTLSRKEKEKWANEHGMSFGYFRKLALASHQSMMKRYKFYKQLIEEKENGMQIMPLQPPIASSIDGEHSSS
jgi:hypothetical protein